MLFWGPKVRSSFKLFNPLLGITVPLNFLDVKLGLLGDIS